MNERWL